MAAQKESFKFGTLLWFIAGLVVPLWPISLPFCWYMAYRSYKSGDDTSDKLAALKNAQDLHDAGAISAEDFQKIKEQNAL